MYNSIGGGFRVGSSTMFMDVFLKWLSLLKEKHNMNALILSIEYSMCIFLLLNIFTKLYM